MTGTSGQLKFTLDLDDPTLAKDISGSFSADLVGPDHLDRGSVELFGDTAFDGSGPLDLGDASSNPFSAAMPNVTTWFLNVASGDLPLSVVLTTSLFSFNFDSFTPKLTIDVVRG